jgi:hypothetical protein
MRFPQAKQGISRDLAGILWISCSSPHTERVFASFRNGNDSQQGISRELAGIFARESAGENSSGSIAGCDLPQFALCGCLRL